MLLAVLALSACDRDAGSTIQSAQALEARGDYVSAIAELTAASRAEPKNGMLRYHLGRVYSLVFDWPAAEHEFRKAGEAGVIEGGRVALGLGRVLFEQRKYREVATEVQAAPAYEAGVLASVHALRGHALMTLDRIEEAKRELDLAAGQDPGNADALLLKVRVTAGRRDVGGALRMVDQLIARDPKNVDAWLHRADILIVMGKFQDALKSLATVIEMQPRHQRALVSRAMILVHMGRLVDAQKDVDTLRQAYPKHPASAYLRGQIHYWRGEYPEALEMAQRTLKVDPDDGPARLLSAMANLMLDAPVQAENELTRYVTHDRGNALAKRVLMDLRAEISQKGREAKALAAIHADGLRSASVQALFGDAYLRVWQHSKVADWFERVADLAPPDPLTAVRHAKRRFLREQLDLAALDLGRVVALNEAVTPADTGLVLVLLALSDTTNAMDAVSMMEKKAPNAPQVATLAGIVLFESNRREEAGQRLDEALKDNPRLIPAALYRVRLDIAAGRPDLARKRFEDVLKIDPDNLHALVFYAYLEEAARRRSEAYGLLNRAVAAHPKALEPMVALLGLLKKDNNKARALVVAEELLAAHPDDPVAIQLAAETQMWTGDQTRGLTTLRRLVTVLPRAPESHFKLARAQFSVGLTAEADASLQRALALPVDEPETQGLSALGLIDDSKTLDALEAARKSIKVRPRSANRGGIESDIWPREIGAGAW